MLTVLVANNFEAMIWLGINVVTVVFWKFLPQHELTISIVKKGDQVTLLLDCMGIVHVIEFLIKLVGKFTCMLDVNMVLGCCSRHLSILS